MGIFILPHPDKETSRVLSVCFWRSWTTVHRKDRTWPTRSLVIHLISWIFHDVPMQAPGFSILIFTPGFGHSGTCTVNKPVTTSGAFCSSISSVLDTRMYLLNIHSWLVFPR